MIFLSISRLLKERGSEIHSRHSFVSIRPNAGEIFTLHFKENVSQNSTAKIADIITNWFRYEREMNQTYKEK